VIVEFFAIGTHLGQRSLRRILEELKGAISIFLSRVIFRKLCSVLLPVAFQVGAMPACLRHYRRLCRCVVWLDGRWLRGRILGFCGRRLCGWLWFCGRRIGNHAVNGRFFPSGARLLRPIVLPPAKNREAN